MTNVERVVKAIEEKEFTITHYPWRAYIEVYEANYKGFMVVRLHLELQVNILYLYLIRKTVTNSTMGYH